MRRPRLTMVPNLFAVALRSLAQRKLRTFLTALGLVIGVAAVVTMLSAGQAAKAQVAAQIDTLGTNLVMVTPGSGMGGGVRTGAGDKRLTMEDTEAVRRESLSAALVGPTARANGALAYGNRNWTSQIQGVTPEYFAIRSWGVVAGAPFTHEHVSSAAKVCILGQEVAEQLFPGEDPIGKTVRLRKYLFKILGVMESKGQSSAGQDQDDVVLAPITTVHRLLKGNDYVDVILLSAVSADKMDTVKAEAEAVLRRRHRIARGSEADFTVRSQSDLSQAANTAANVMTILLGGIASVSLLVGGIGIMNIMLVSVSERTREIGIRMAVGARGRDILFQFLTEAVTVCLLGGIPGAALGWAGAALISRGFGWPLIVDASSFALAFGFSAGVGLFFGIYPAWRASRLDPVEALRYE